MKIKDKFILKEGSGKIYFMSDLHYGHNNVIKYDDRGFDTVENMNSYIVSKLNKLNPDDIVFDLGDMFWNTPLNEIKEILESIPCKNIYKIMGNHDKYGLYYDQAPLKSYFKIISDILDIQIEYNNVTYMITLSHYPIVSWNHKSQGSIMVHGHCHGNIDQYNDSVYDLRLDIGYGSKIAKNLGTFLVPFEDILNYFCRKTGNVDFKKWTINNCNNL